MQDVKRESSGCGIAGSPEHNRVPSEACESALATPPNEIDC